MGLSILPSLLFKKLNVKMNGVDVYDCSEANQATNIKNLLEYSQGYSKSQGTNEFFLLTQLELLQKRIIQVFLSEKRFYLVILE